MEKMIKVTKNNITKNIQENLINDYLKLGWKIAKEKEIAKKENKIKLVGNKNERKLHD